MGFNPIITSATSTLYYKNDQLYEESVDNRLSNICRRIFCRSCYNPNLILNHIKQIILESPSLSAEQRNRALKNYTTVIAKANSDCKKYEKTNLIIKIFKCILFGKPKAIRKDLLQFQTQHTELEQAIGKLKGLALGDIMTLSTCKELLNTVKNNFITAYEEQLFDVMDLLFPKLVEHVTHLNNQEEETSCSEFADLETIVNILTPMLDHPRFNNSLHVLKDAIDKKVQKVQSEFNEHLDYDIDASIIDTEFFGELNIAYPSDLLSMIRGDLPELLRTKEDPAEIDLHGLKRNNAPNLKKILVHLELFYIRDLQEKDIYSKTAFKRYLQTVNIAKLSDLVKNVE